MTFIAPAVKFLLILLFLNNIGLFSLDLPKSDYPSAPEKPDRGKADIQYLNEKVKRAEKMGRSYTPECYFADLTEIRLKEKANDFDRWALPHVNYSIQSMMAVFNDNLTNSRKYLNDAEYGKLMEKLDQAREKHLLTLDPKHGIAEAALKAEMAQPGYWTKQFLKSANWLSIFYLKNLPLAFILLLLWWYKDKETFRINNPLSFLICLLFYPLVIIRVWKKQLNLGSRMFAMSIELKRRQKDIFSLISDDELSDLKRFARSNLKISDYRLYLENRGFTERQALTPLILVTTIFLLAPKLQAHELPDYQEIKSTCCFVTNTDPSQIDYDIGWDNFPPLDANLNWLDRIIPRSLPVVKILLPFLPEEKPGFKDNPDPVPMVG